MSEQKPEEALSNAGRLLRSYADASLDAIYLKDRNSRWLFVNPALERIAGKSAAELLGKTDAEIYSNLEIGKTIMANDKKVMGSGKAETFEEFMDLPDGRHYFISVKSPRFDEKRNVIGLLGISHDITNRKRREEQIRENRKALQKEKTILQEVMNGTENMHLVYLDKDFNFVRVNKAYAKTCGYTPEQMIGKNHFVLYPHEENEAIFKRVRDTGEAAQFHDKPFVFPDQPERGVTYWDWTLKPIKDDLGKVEGLVFSLVETTERKKSEEALRRSEERYRSFIEVTGELGWTTNAGGEVVEDLPSWRNYTGQTYDEIKGSGWSKALHPDDLNRTLRVWRQAVNKKKKYEVEYRIRRFDGVYRYFMARGIPVFDNEKNLREWVGTCIDITNRKKAAEALRKSMRLTRQHAENLEKLQKNLEKKAAEVEKYATIMEQLAEERAGKLRDAERLATIGATAGMVGHDIRNPLQSISGDIYLALKELVDLPHSEQKQNIKENLEEINKSVEYINKIVRDLQDFARPIIPAAKEVSLEELFEEVLFKNGAPENIEASYEVEGRVKKIVTDPEVLKRILSNLVSNAFQAIPQGGKIDLHAFHDKEEAVITVQDNGMGIPEDIKPKLFTPLFTTKSKGQGFGLAVVKRLTEALGGTVSLESEFGQGTKFIIHLPQKN